MKNKHRLILSLFSAIFVSFVSGWGLIIHHLRFETMAKSAETISAATAARADLGTFMSLIVASGCLTTAGLTWVFYRAVK